MSDIDVLTVLGARPQFIKASAVSPCFSAANINEMIVHTGQHFDDNMSRVFFDELGMRKADVNLDIHGGSHGVQTGRMLISLEEIILDRKPRCVLVYGDTNTTLAGALAAAKLHVPVVHVEAGLRSYNKKMPEEINRICTDQVSDLMFTPSEVAGLNLQRENFDPDKIIFSGDVMYDVALKVKAAIKDQNAILESCQVEPGGYILATVHRAENTDVDESLRNIVRALSSLAKEMPVVLPLHPRTRASLQRIGELDSLVKAINVIEPVGYLDMVSLEMNAGLIVTDSGGVQKEAYFHEVPSVTLRNETEWEELLESGFTRLAGTDETRILACAKEALQGRQVDWSRKLYGEGNAGSVIADEIAELLAR